MRKKKQKVSKQESTEDPNLLDFYPEVEEPINRLLDKVLDADLSEQTSQN